MPEFELTEEVSTRYMELQDIFAALDEELAQQALRLDEDVRITEEELHDLLKEWVVARIEVYEWVKKALESEYPVNEEVQESEVE